LASRSAITARGVVAVERGRQVALGDQHVANSVMRDGELALPAGICRIGFGEPVGNNARGVVAVERGRQVAYTTKMPSTPDTALKPFLPFR
jgi:hypothetical protein